MLPDNSLSLKPLAAPYISPAGRSRTKLTLDYELGGIAIQNPSQGLQYQVWKCEWEDGSGNITLTPEKTGSPVVIMNVVGLHELSFAFDQNMRYILGLLYVDGTFNLHWYDTSVGAYVVTPYDDIQAFALSLDDKRASQIAAGASDIIFTYIRTNSLYFRAQRDRYTIEYTLSTDMAGNWKISNFGMAQNMRMQWRIKERSRLETLP